MSYELGHMSFANVHKRNLLGSLSCLPGRHLYLPSGAIRTWSRLLNSLGISCISGVSPLDFDSLELEDGGVINHGG